MDLRGLMAETGETARNIRYLIAEGVMPGPRGSRAAPDYGPDHVEAVRRYQRLRAAGYPLSAIRLLLAGGQPARLPIAPGIALQIDAASAGGALDPARIGRAVERALRRFADARPPDSSGEGDET